MSDARWIRDFRREGTRAGDRLLGVTLLCFLPIVIAGVVLGHYEPLLAAVTIGLFAPLANRFIGWVLIR